MEMKKTYVRLYGPMTVYIESLVWTYVFELLMEEDVASQSNWTSTITVKTD